MSRLRLLSLFSGIGAFEKALSNLNITYDLVAFSEIDKFASKAYCLIHNESENKNLGDINLINEKNLPDFDLMTYGFPCQSFSIQGERLGFEDPERGNLFFESMRIAREKRPKYMIAENVKGLINHDKGRTFDIILTILKSLGYNNYYKVVNAKDHGVPQARERIFIVSIRKDIDHYGYQFPEGTKLTKTFYDFLENEVDDKYNREDYFKSKSKYHNLEYDDMTILKLIENGEKISKRNDGLIYTLTASGRNSGNNLYICKLKRVLTPVESWKLMGFDRSDAIKCKESGISDSQLYKMAGNSIVVNVLEDIFKNLLISKEIYLDKKEVVSI